MPWPGCSGWRSSTSSPPLWSSGYNTTRGSPLPLVELVMMTLTAEALGHVRKIRRRLARLRPAADKNGPAGELSTDA